MRPGLIGAIVFALLLPASQIAQQSEAEKLIQSSDCSSCHAVDHQIVGPAFNAIAKRYASQDGAAAQITAKIREGGNGMPAHPDLTAAQAGEIAKWILSQKDSAAAPAETGSHTYSLKDGTTVSLDFLLFAEGKAPKVSKDVFKGYQLYNSYCYRCHGTDATGGQLGPDLRRSLSVGMKAQDFLAVAMSGRKEQGMPSWAGFLSEQEVRDIYQYVKGRSLDLIPSGRPPSEQD